uniref:Ena/VASP-like protein n=1 Tax=Petromyzon marinus TaxID=7757 RepID=A0AAJ7XJT7_PETMA|nr:ena/VASP-like protein [Petromyzon marinus]
MGVGTRGGGMGVTSSRQSPGRLRMSPSPLATRSPVPPPFRPLLGQSRGSSPPPPPPRGVARAPTSILRRDAGGQRSSLGGGQRSSPGGLRSSPGGQRSPSGGQSSSSAMGGGVGSSRLPRVGKRSLPIGNPAVGQSDQWRDGCY